MAGFVSGYTGKGGLMTMEQAGMTAQTKMEQIKAKNMEEQFGPNKKAGEVFLAKKKADKDVKALPSGVLYKVIKEESTLRGQTPRRYCIRQLVQTQRADNTPR